MNSKITYLNTHFPTPFTQIFNPQKYHLPPFHPQKSSPTFHATKLTNNKAPFVLPNYPYIHFKGYYLILVHSFTCKYTYAYSTLFTAATTSLLALLPHHLSIRRYHPSSLPPMTTLQPTQPPRTSSISSQTSQPNSKGNGKRRNRVYTVSFSLQFSFTSLTNQRTQQAK